MFKRIGQILEPDRQMTDFRKRLVLTGHVTEQRHQVVGQVKNLTALR